MKLSLNKFAALLFVLFMGATVYASNPLFDEELTVEIEKKEPLPHNGKPRSLVERDVEATYCAGVLTLLFNVDLGDADIVVSNVTSGEVWSDSVNGYGVVTLFLSGEEGYYYIDISTDEEEYTGEFRL